MLFPAVGTVKDAKVLHKGKEYALPKHGIIRNNEQLLVGQPAPHHLVFSLESSVRTKSLYPFDFRFEAHYELQASSLLMRYRIENRGSEDLYYNAGGHTAYYCPLDQWQLNDYFIEFPGKNKLIAETLDPESLLLGYAQREISLNNGQLALSETTFKRDALVFADVDCDAVRLARQGEAKGLQVKFSGFPHLALWAKPGADYVCIEPWLGLPDRVDAPLEISEKPNYTKLAAGETQSLLIETVIE